MSKSTYNPDYCRMAEVACRLGAIDKDLQALFGVCEKTLHNWRNKHPEFKAATAMGKDDANNQVIQALFRRATGCVTFKDVLDRGGCPVRLEVEHPPETAACMSWLHNRDRDNWQRDPQARKDTDDNSDKSTYNITIVKPDAPDNSD